MILLFDVRKKTNHKRRKEMRPRITILVINIENITNTSSVLKASLNIEKVDQKYHKNPFDPGFLF